MTYSRGAKHLVWRFARPVYRRMQKPAPQEFSIGIAIGDSPWSVRLSKSIANPVLTRDDVTDVPATLVADPFMCQRDGRWYLFFEVVNQGDTPCNRHRMHHIDAHPHGDGSWIACVDGFSSNQALHDTVVR